MFISDDSTTTWLLCGSTMCEVVFNRIWVEHISTLNLKKVTKRT